MFAVLGEHSIIELTLNNNDDAFQKGIDKGVLLAAASTSSAPLLLSSSKMFVDGEAGNLHEQNWDAMSYKVTDKGGAAVNKARASCAKLLRLRIVAMWTESQRLSLSATNKYKKFAAPTAQRRVRSWL